MAIVTSWLVSPYAWTIVFFAFTLLEFSTGGVFSLLCGLGALVTALALYSEIITQPGYAVLTFLLSSVALTALLWKPLQRMMQGLKSDPADTAVEPFVGDIATVDSGPITHNGGHIRLHGSKLVAVLSEESDQQSLAEGTQVTVLKMDKQQRFVVVPVRADA